MIKGQRLDPKIDRKRKTKAGYQCPKQFTVYILQLPDQYVVKEHTQVVVLYIQVH